MAKTSKVKAGTALRDVDAPFFRYWQALYLSFFSGLLYIDVAKRWKGLGIGYLLLLICIASLPLSAHLAYDFNSFYEGQIITPLKKIPTLYIQNGLLTLDKPMPYRIKNKAGKVVLIIDTTGQVTTIDITNPDLTMLLTRDQFLYRLPVPKFYTSGSSLETRTVYTAPFNKEMNQVFDGDQWVKSSGIERVKWISDFLFFPIVAMIFFVLYWCFFLVCTFMAQLGAKLFIRQSLTYKQACRLFIVSSTPAVALFFIALATTAEQWFVGPMVLIVMVLYFLYAVYVFKQEGNQLLRS